MPFDAAKLIDYQIPEIEQNLTPEACILYALGLGLGTDPLDKNQLKFVYEEGLMALPTMAAVLAYPGFWVRSPDTGVDWVKVLHGEQGIVLHKPPPTSGALVGKSRVTDIIDKGPGKGALIYTARDVTDKATGERIATLTMSTFARGDGGSGTVRRSGDQAPLRLGATPDRKPDKVCDLAIPPQAALIYRLSGDRNPLHADPGVATKAGFKAPILHGLCSLGVAGHAVLKSCCAYDPAALKEFSLRFSAPVYPGETLRTKIWEDGNDRISFISEVVERDIVVLKNGHAALR